MPGMDWSTAAWVAWIAAFVILESAALARRAQGAQDETLSAHVWRWFAIRGPRDSARTWAGRGVLLVAGVWLTGHLAFGWWAV